MTTYQLLYAASVAVTAILAGLAAIQLGDPASYGLTPVMVKWVGVLTAVLGIVNGVLPPLQRTPTSKDNSGPRDDPDPLPRDQ